MPPRNYLFDQTDPDPALTRLIATSARVTGFMKGAPGEPRPGWYAPGRDNQVILRALHDNLSLTYSDAGPALWAVRLWTNLIWQPAYLAVIAVHVHGALPDLGRLSQQTRGIYADGFRLPPGPQQQGSTEHLIAMAGADLKRDTDMLFDELKPIARLRPLLAKRLLAHRMLSIMVRLTQWRPDYGPDLIHEHCRQWLTAMSLTGQGDLEPVTLDNDKPALIVARKGCCLDYLIAPHAYCATCPKQSDAVRIARLRANALAESSPG